MLKSEPDFITVNEEFNRFLRQTKYWIKTTATHVWRISKSYTLNLDTDYIMTIIWVVTAATFFIFAGFAFFQMWATIPPYKTETLPGGIFNGSIDVAKLVNGLVDSYNNNMSALQKTSREQAQLTFLLNLISGISAVVGFFAQRTQMLKKKRQE